MLPERTNPNSDDQAAHRGLVRRPAYSVEDIRASLQELGAPEISEDDISRLYKGRMVEVLDLVARQVVGRNRAASARAAIQQFRQSSNARRPHVEDGVDPVSTDARKADSHLRNASASLTASQISREEQKQNLVNIEREQMELQKMLEEKRRTALLLSVLERKEKIRNDRFLEISSLLEELRQQTTKMKAHSMTGSSPQDLRIQIKPQRAEYTRDTLSALQAHALRVSRLSQSAQDAPSPSRVKKVEQRLLQAVAGSLSSATDDEKVASAFQAFRAACKAQAQLSVQFRSPLPPESQDAENIQQLGLRVCEKEDELQDLVDHSSALTVTCAQSLQSITEFANETSPALRDALREESKSAQGHVDVLRLSIINRGDSPAVPTPTGDAGLSRGQSFEAVLASIQQQAAESQETERFLREIETLNTSPANQDRHASLTEHHVKEEAELSERIKKLLERKGRKTEAGQLLIKDTERLVGEVGLISGAHV